MKSTPVTSIKKYITLTILLTSTIWCTAQQVWTTEPVKKCSKICITNTLTSDEMLKKTISVLSNGGYVIKDYWKDLYMVNTQPNFIGSYQYELNMRIETTDSTRLYISGYYWLPGFFERAPIDKRGMNGSPALDVWDRMNLLSEMMPGTRSYLKP